MKKIGIICYPTYGGSGVVATELGKKLSERGFQIHFITYGQPIRLQYIAENIFFHEVNTFSYPLFKYPPYEIALASKIVNVVEAQKLDLLHVHYAIPHATSAVLAQQILSTKGIKIPFITTLHGTDISLVGKDPSFTPVVSHSIESSNAITTISENLKAKTYEFFDVKKNISVIPNFINLNYFKRNEKSHFRNAIAPDNEKIIVHTSNFRKVKKVDDVLYMFEKLSKIINAKLLMVGDGPEKQNMEVLAVKLKIEKDIRFLGKLNEVPEILSVTDLFVMPSAQESFGLAALEALACQVPVIASNIGGIPELVEDGKSGILFDVGDVESMVKAALHILNNKNLSKFRKDALARAEKFNDNRIIPIYEELYLNTIENL